MGAGMTISIALYNMFAVSSLAFVLQFIEPTAEVITAKRNMLHVLTAGPRYTFPPDMLFCLKRAGLSVEFQHIGSVSIAARARA